MGLNTAKTATRSLLGACFLTLLGSVHAPVTVGDDTEIYHATLSASGTARPKVMILMDTSGSMTIEAVAASNPAYDPSETYVDSGFENDRIYWVKGSADLPSPGTAAWFPADRNRCDTSYAPLGSVGYYQDRVRRLQFRNGRARWRPLRDNDQSPIHVDCWEDTRSPENAGNGPGQSDGFPINPVDQFANPPTAYASSNSSSSSGLFRTNDLHYLYTGHYLNYKYDTTLAVAAKNRLEVAQEVVNDLVNANPSIDFGLAVFNHNSDGALQGYQCSGGVCDVPIYNSEGDNGGRIITHLKENMTVADRNALAGPSGTINSLTATGSTPLCESTYEVYRYLAGLAPWFGLKEDTQVINNWPQDFIDGKDGTVDTPSYDTSALVSSTEYNSPTTDCAFTYVILMTDGFPSLDTDVNDKVEADFGVTCGTYALDGGGSAKNCLAEVTRYMANNDLDGDSSNGDQFGITYTIGFATDQTLLEEAATNGKGNYYTAYDTDALENAFKDALLEILSKETSFTSPSVAVNTFTRTESRNEVFFAMFQPDGSKDWNGNVKRLDIAYVADGAGNFVKKLVDKDGDEAIDPATGLIAAAAETVWLPSGAAADGPLVNRGGVGELLAARDLTTRNVLTNTGTNGALESFEVSNITPEAYGFDTSAPSDPDGALYAFWDVDDAADLNKSIQWGIGYDTEDADEDLSTTDNRPWILADILHSRPRVISYGLINNRDEETEGSDLRILVGTNGGFLHMFGNDDGEEDWAFFPKELAQLLTARRLGDTAVDRPYGVDDTAIIYTYDDNKDGTFDHTDGDKVWAFVGLRRGGRNLYGLDISNPDNPSLLWAITPDLLGFSELGQTWSTPDVTYIPGYSDLAGKPKPVLVFGAGYDPAKDDHDSFGDATDSIGRGVFIVDAETGALVWSVTPAASSSVNKQATELTASVAAPVTTLDSNGDGLSDRIYFADVAGVLWRIDLAGATRPTTSSEQANWLLTKLFTAVHGTRSKANDRRFFSEPDVVRIEKDDRPIDAILIGSGDRTNPSDRLEDDEPLSPAVENQFYMIPDRAILPQTALTTADCASPEEGSLIQWRCRLPLNTDPTTPEAQGGPDFFDATSNVLDADSGASTTAIDDAEEALYDRGWYITLTGNGEKSLSKSLTVAGKVFFGTFTPGVSDPTASQALCSPAPGRGLLYGVNIYDATNIPQFDSRYRELGEQIPDTPAAHVDRNREFSIIPPQGAGGSGGSDLIGLGSKLPAPYGSFWYREEY